MDRLEVLRGNKIEFEVFLKPKDLKNLSKKDEILTSRVHIEAKQESTEGFVIELNTDP
jgi:hypothetical protein